LQQYKKFAIIVITLEISAERIDCMVVYSIVVPLYNEEEVIRESYKRLKAVMDDMSESYELVFVNDGSRDKTTEIARELAENDKNLRIISFSRNFGHQIAITAGMDAAVGQAVVVIDADLQDPPEVIPEMAAKWKEGWQVVYGKRGKREGETLFKKLTAKAFYRTINAMTDIEMPVDSGDFRLLDRKVIDVLKTLPEHNRYVRGLVTWVGFKQTFVEYTRHERFAGETKYPLRKMIKFASDGMVSFSHTPLKIGNLLGVLMFVGGLVLLIVMLAQFGSYSWVFLSLPGVLICNGLVLMYMSVQGQYLARMYDEAKNRPLYIIGEVIN
jgi:dolichol-phosphate mannosyltransferase